MNDDYLKIDKKEYLITENIIKTTTFLDLFMKRRNSVGSTGATAPTGVVSKPQTTVDVSPQQSVDTSQGRAYDASKMWSPQSSNFNSYEWYRGVIGISNEGEMLVEKLNGTMFHHADRTVLIANSLGASINDTLAPFEAGLNASSEGILIMQFEGDAGLVYFPQSISASQLDCLISTLIPRSNYEFQFAYGDKIFEEQSYGEVIGFAVNLSRSVGVRM